MKIRWQYCLTALLALLGFGSCQGLDPIEDDNVEDVSGGWGMTAYGQPYATYKVLGEVKAPNGKRIEGIRVVVNPKPGYPSFYNDTLYTDAQGKFQFERLKYTGLDGFATGTIKFEDVDGSKNGSFKTKVLDPGEYTVKKTSEGKGWHEGSYEVTAKTKLEKAQ